MAVSANYSEENDRWRLRRRLYKFRPLAMLDCLVHSLNWPLYTSFNTGIACVLPTTAELKEPYLRLVDWLLLPWLCFLLTLITLPFAILGFLLDRILLKLRTPYRYCETRPQVSAGKQLNYSFASVNVCLGAEWLCRYNNLGQNSARAVKMGSEIAIQQSDSFHYDRRVNGVQPCRNPPRLGTALEFPGLDILCFQEVFDRGCARGLIAEISPVFPYIVHDARASVLSELMNSGLMIASRHAITHVNFHRFKDSLGVHKVMSMGVLMCKVALGRDDRTGQSGVGYIATTHLQCYAGDSPVVRHQLTELYHYVTSFRAQTRSRDEHVMFDVIAGDFNFDNMSPVDTNVTNHPLFSQYVDVCRLGPGVDRNWAVGTERRHRTLHNYEASYPEGLKSCLDDKSVCQLYLINADIQTGETVDCWEMPERDEEGQFIQNPLGGRRRVDYCLYNKDDSLVVTGYNFVTQLASLTDHIPVSMTIMAPQL